MQKKLLVLLLNMLVSGYSIGQDSTTIVNDSIYDYVDVDPEFPGGMTSLNQFLIENLDFPLNHCDQDKIYFRIIVETDGSVTNRKISNEECPTLKAEVARLILIMPKWKPGIVDGEPVRVAFTIPMFVCFR